LDTLKAKTLRKIDRAETKTAEGKRQRTSEKYQLICVQKENIDKKFT